MCARALVCLLLVAGSSVADSLSSATLDLSAYRGKVVMVDFWASWCTPCRRSFPWMNELRSRYEEAGLVILAVNVDSDRREADRFLAQTPAAFDILWDPEGEIASDFGVIAMPSTYIIGRDGGLLATHLGFKRNKRDEYEAVLRRALGVSP